MGDSDETSTAGQLFVVVFGLVFVVAGLGVAYLGYSSYQETQDINDSVETVNGTVTSTDMPTETELDDDEQETEYFPQASYEYTVDGEEYTGEYIFSEVDRDSDPDEPPAKEFESRSKAENALPNEGEEVTVYYFPNEPDRAFLKKPTAGLGDLAVPLGGGLLFSLVGAGVAYGGLTGRISNDD